MRNTKNLIFDRNIIFRKMPIHKPEPYNFNTTILEDQSH